MVKQKAPAQLSMAGGQGMMLAELLMVLSILSILLALAAPLLSKQLRRSQLRVTHDELSAGRRQSFLPV